MASANANTGGLHHPGHVPFYMRLLHGLKDPQRIVRVISIDDGLVTIDDSGVRTTLWTHAPAADFLARDLESDVDRLSVYRQGLYLTESRVVSLTDPENAADCREPDMCRNNSVPALALEWRRSEKADSQATERPETASSS